MSKNYTLGQENSVIDQDLTRLQPVFLELPNTHVDLVVVATYGWKHLSPNKHPYFTITGEAWYYERPTDAHGDPIRGESPSKLAMAKITEGEPDISGTMPSILRDAYPGLNLMVTAHSNDAVTGEPMYAHANAWYFYQSAIPNSIGEIDKYPANLPERYQHLDSAGRAAAYLGCSPLLFETSGGSLITHEEFDKRVDRLRPAWSNLAKSIVSTYQLRDPSA